MIKPLACMPAMQMLIKTKVNLEVMASIFFVDLTNIFQR